MLKKYNKILFDPLKIRYLCQKFI
ncbi:MAG: hypothetical protein RIS89_103, partial [Bacteroidota bacterium]